MDGIGIIHRGDGEDFAPLLLTYTATIGLFHVPPRPALLFRLSVCAAEAPVRSSEYLAMQISLRPASLIPPGYMCVDELREPVIRSA